MDKEADTRLPTRWLEFGIYLGMYEHMKAGCQGDVRRHVDFEGCTFIENIAGIDMIAPFPSGSQWRQALESSKEVFFNKPLADHFRIGRLCNIENQRLMICEPDNSLRTDKF